MPILLPCPEVPVHLVRMAWEGHTLSLCFPWSLGKALSGATRYMAVGDARRMLRRWLSARPLGWGD